MKKTEAMACRVTVVLARKAPVAAVLRRGPSKWVQLLRWRTDTDSFDDGQWFHGRIYDRRCDLSLDGQFFVYFASKFTRRTLHDREVTYAWTAISKLPYLTALALWPKGDCWHGGGLFQSSRTVWLNHKPEVAKPKLGKHPVGLRVIPNPDAAGEDAPIWEKRRKRDGWELVQRGVFRHGKRGFTAEVPELWRRPGPGGLHLYQRVDGFEFWRPGGGYVEVFWIRRESGAEIPIEAATWADFDQQGRLVFSRSGSLFAARVLSTKLEERALIDLTERKPTQVEAPAWAARWETTG